MPRKRKLPGTRAQRAAYQFEPCNLELPITNEEWARMTIPSVRIGIDLLNADNDKLEEFVRKFLETGPLDETFEFVGVTKRRLRKAIEIIEKAELRLRIVAERFEDPPPAKDNVVPFPKAVSLWRAVSV